MKTDKLRGGFARRDFAGHNLGPNVENQSYSDDKLLRGIECQFHLMMSVCVCVDGAS